MSPTPPLAGKKFLVVDDESFQRSIIYNFCYNLGADNVMRASNGAEAIEILMAEPTIDLVICDVNMPVMSGLEMLQAIRIGFNNIPNTLPVIMLTGDADVALVGGALAFDADCFLVKPVSKLILAERILMALRGDTTVRPPDHYATINLKAVQAAIRRMAAQKKAEEKAGEKVPPKPIPKGARVVTLDEIVLPAVLAEELRLPTGEELIPAGTTLTPRLLERLRELRPLGIACDRLVVC